MEDLDSVILRDPATSSRIQAALFSSGFHAITLYRLAHFLWKKDWHTLARFISLITRFLTGIEIHPAAVIGRGFFIDHGMGVVIGETTTIGNNVTLYQNVTLGGTNLFDQTGKNTSKRHPDVGDNVVIGASAQILGPIKIGNNAKIGAGAIVVKDVEENATMIGYSAHKSEKENINNKKFCAYGIPKNIADPVDEELYKIKSQIKELEEKIKRIDQKNEK